MGLFDRLFGKRQPDPALAAATKVRDDLLATQGKQATDQVEQAKVIREAVDEVDRLKNGIIHDFEEAEKGIKGRP